MPLFRCVVSFESDRHPVETCRVFLEATDEEDAIRRGLRRAIESRLKKWRPGSLVIAAEPVDQTGVKTINKTGPEFLALEPDTAF